MSISELNVCMLIHLPSVVEAMFFNMFPVTASPQTEINFANLNHLESTPGRSRNNSCCSIQKQYASCDDKMCIHSSLLYLYKIKVALFSYKTI